MLCKVNTDIVYLDPFCDRGFRYCPTGLMAGECFYLADVILYTLCHCPRECALPRTSLIKEVHSGLDSCAVKDFKQLGVITQVTFFGHCEA